uniref:Uncharacterized protein n=1 Tax=Arundo donax TaxID=35708 RepID=A0A0A9GIY5_ARUDO
MGQPSHLLPLPFLAMLQVLQTFLSPCAPQPPSQMEDYPAPSAWQSDWASSPLYLHFHH